MAVKPARIPQKAPDLNDLFLFAQVVGHGGFSAASRSLDIPKSRLSRRISGLEERLGVRLVQRSTRTFAITAAGQLFLQHCQRAVAEAEAAEAAVMEIQKTPRGLVRISCPITMAEAVLGQLLPQYLIDHPQVRVEVTSTNRSLNLIERAIDIALVIHKDQLPDSSLVVRFLGVSRQVLVASPHLTSTDPYWIGKVDEDEEKTLRFDYDLYYRGATKLIESLIFDVDIPTIAAVNGPGYHTEIALLCDLTICSEQAIFQDGHFLIGFVPGDGQLLTFQELIGTKRASYALYTGQKIDARTALEWGLVNEVLPREKLLERAWELAAQIMKQPRAARCLTHHLLARPWKQRIISDFQAHISHEGYGIQVSNPEHNLNAIRDDWRHKKK